MTLGSLLARGRTSEVFAYGNDLVVKVPRQGVPEHWAGIEARIAGAVHDTGLPTPAVLEVVDVEGRESIVFERIYGPSMWELLVENPERLPDLTAQMIEVQRAINTVEAPAGVPNLRRRTFAKIGEADFLTEDERENAVGLTTSLPIGSSLCHGDLHPGNILMGSSGPVVIDWFDACAGHRAADLVRTSLLIRPLAGDGGPTHLPGASPALLRELHQLYLADVVAQSGATTDQLLRWERVLAASRLAEQTNEDHEELLALWRSTDGPDPCETQLSEALLALENG